MTDPQLLILIATFVTLLLMNAPIAVAIAVASLLAIASLGDGRACDQVAQKMSAGIASFPLLAIPFFVLAGILMGEGGMAQRLIRFAAALVGGSTGGLAYVCTLTCMMFGAISGSATAAVSSIGGALIPEMTRNGYDRRFSVAVATTAATTGMIIPPSNIMIVYAVVTGDVSVAALFMAGVVPGIVVGLAILAASWHQCRRHDYGAGESRAASEVAKAAWGALPSLLLVVIVLTGILGGVFSATEAAVIAVAYAFVLAVFAYRTVRLADMPRHFLQTGITTAVIFFLIGASQAMSWILAYERIPQQASSAILGISDNWLVIMLLINFVLLMVGTFMDMTPAVLIFTPILLPVATRLGMDPVHFGIMMIVNLCIGLCTPPVGTCLFVGCGVGKTTIAEVTRPMIPFFIAMLAALMLITYIPAISMWLPKSLGLD